MGSALVRLVPSGPGPVVNRLPEHMGGVVDAARVSLSPARMVQRETLVQSPNESSGQMSPQTSMKRKKADDDSVNGSKKARTRVRSVLVSSYDNKPNPSYVLTSSGSATLAENVTAVSRGCVQDFLDL